MGSMLGFIEQVQAMSLFWRNTCGFAKGEPFAGGDQGGRAPLKRKALCLRCLLSVLYFELLACAFYIVLGNSRDPKFLRRASPAQVG